MENTEIVPNFSLDVLREFDVTNKEILIAWIGNDRKKAINKKHCLFVSHAFGPALKFTVFWGLNYDKKQI